MHIIVAIGTYFTVSVVVGIAVGKFISYGTGSNVEKSEEKEVNFKMVQV